MLMLTTVRQSPDLGCHSGSRWKEECCMNVKDGRVGEGGSVLFQRVKQIGFAQCKATDSPVDVGIAATGHLQDIGESLTSDGYDHVIALDDAYISPGWIDLHTHVCDFAREGLQADLIGPATGVALLVDVGSTGHLTFPGFRRYIADVKPYPIRALLNIVSSKLSPTVGYHHEAIDYFETKRCIEQNRDIIRGVKIMASKRLIKDFGLGPILVAKRVAVDSGVPLMLHIGEAPPFWEEIVDILGPGDAVTHCFHGKAGNSLRDSADRLIPVYKEAIKKGILMDLGHGGSSFSVASARTAISERIPLHTISSDLHANNLHGPVFSLANVMSKMLPLGLSLHQIIEGVAAHPAAFIGEAGWCTLSPGEPVNATIFRLKRGGFEFKDSGTTSDYIKSWESPYQEVFDGDTFIAPCYVYCQGRLYESMAAPYGD
jgi:dihydroorotase